VAGCASASLYKRKSKPAKPGPAGIMDAVLQKTGLSSGEPKGESTATDSSSCGIGEWDPIFLGRADYLDNGLERDWSFRDVVFVDGEVITVRLPFRPCSPIAIADKQDNGDRIPHPPEDAIPTGLAKGMEKYLRRGFPEPNGRIKEAILASGGGKEANGSKM
jgi:transcription factor C subunit 7